MTTAYYDDKYGETHEITLNEKEMGICNASFNEVILYYLVDPGYFLTKLYETITTFTWKF